MSFKFAPLDVLDYHTFMEPRLDARSRRIAGPKSFLQGPAWSVKTPEGEYVACFGFIPLHAGVAEAWLVPNPAIYAKHVALTFRGTKRIFSSVVASKLFHRIHALCPEEYEVGRRLMEHLGMRFECAMLKYGPQQETWVRYVIFP